MSKSIYSLIVLLISVISKCDDSMKKDVPANFASSLFELVQSEVKARTKQLDEREKILEQREKVVNKALQNDGVVQEKITVRVGQDIYYTSLDILVSVPDTYFVAMVNLKKNSKKSEGEELIQVDTKTKPCQTEKTQESQEYFIPRDGKLFAYILEYLTYKDIYSPIPTLGTLKKLLIDAQFYQITPLIKKLKRNILSWSGDDRLQGSDVDGCRGRGIAKFSSTSSPTNGYWSWNNIDIPPSSCYFTANENTLTVLRDGLYLINIQITGNSNTISLYVNESEVSRVVENSGYKYLSTLHINEVFTLKKGDRLRVHYGVGNHRGYQENYEKGESVKNQFSIMQVIVNNYNDGNETQEMEEKEMNDKNETNERPAVVKVASTLGVSGNGIWNWNVNEIPPTPSHFAIEGNTITILQNGLYGVYIRVSGTCSSNRNYMALYINGSEVSRSIEYSGGSIVSWHINELFQLKKGDKLSVFHSLQSSQNVQLQNKFSIVNY